MSVGKRASDVLRAKTKKKPPRAAAAKALSQPRQRHIWSGCCLDVAEMVGILERFAKWDIPRHVQISIDELNALNADFDASRKILAKHKCG